MTYVSAFLPSSLYSHKENYLRYLDSRQWQEVKRAYWLSNRPQECWSCGKKWRLGEPGFNFHHINYKNLYSETLEDLVLLCAEHHKKIEQDKPKFDKNMTLELFTYAYVCAERVHRGLSLKPVLKFMKGMID